MGLNITIIGVGLIGGSLGLAFKESPRVDQVLGVDPNGEALEKACHMGAIDRAVSLAEGVKSGQVLFLCSPVGTFAGLIDSINRYVQPGTVVTDVGSTKQQVLKMYERLPREVCSIGGHPMAGSEIMGIDGADRYLFENAVYILTPREDTAAEKLEMLEELLEVTGARIKLMTAETHDRMVAAVSHIPHLAAAALVNLTGGDEQLLMLAAGGFRDTTRVASSSPGLWQDILFSNQVMVVDALDRYIQILTRFKEQLMAGEKMALFNNLKKAQETRCHIPRVRKGLMPSLNEVICIVPDRPGIIGDLGVILGQARVNIADIEILRVREGDGGTIRLGVPSLDDAEVAVKVLQRHSIKAWVR